MALSVKEVVNKTDSELVVIDTAKKSIEPVSPHSAKELTDEDLFDLTFVSKTHRPIYIRIKSIIGNGNSEPAVEVEAGDPEDEELPN